MICSFPLHTQDHCVGPVGEWSDLGNSDIYEGLVVCPLQEILGHGKSLSASTTLFFQEFPLICDKTIAEIQDNDPVTNKVAVTCVLIEV